MTDLLARVTYSPIGLIRTPFTDPHGMPIQASAAVGIRGRIELDPALGEGLADIEGFSHLTLLYHLHEVVAARLTVTPFLDDRPHGIFATRAPARPNPIGLSTVRLVGVHGPTLEIEDVDILDATPLLDIKPYVPAFDERTDVRIGWLVSRLDRLAQAQADCRFSRTLPLLETDATTDEPTDR
ncbi:MAG: tRNA (N6-threonylcarbamoyladenosine(37)-N6)-methyltransferase TrmO [Candidatus Limnocylindrales bacterium]|jgi:tRNA (adenine37-N6)-methyltransferase